MKREEIINKMKSLTSQINKLNYNYYTLDEPLVSDGEYDKLFSQLKKLEEETSIVLSGSPTQKVGWEILDKFEKHSHIAPLYSMDKAQSFAEIESWEVRNKKFLTEDEIKELDYVVELKFDGLTINLTYDNGNLVMASTRGNGFIGEEILPQVKTIKSIPLKIPFKGKMEVQGEGLMPLSSFNEYNKNAEEKLKNARNAAAGALRNLDSSVTASRNLTAYFYNVGYIEGKDFLSDEQMKDFLMKNGFKISSINYHCKNLKEVREKIEEIGEKRQSLDILIDGVTIKVNDIKTRENLGFTNRFPRWAIAYKFEAEEASTRLIDVEWNVGRTSKVTPSAILEPVEIGGVTIKRATLNNYDDIQRKKLKLNSRVLIRRSNDVIPEILGALPTEEETFEIDLPKCCPACGSELFKDGVHIFCPNTLSCFPQLVSRLTHFASRDAMNIEGLSEMTISQFIRDLKITEISQIYELRKKDLLKLEGFKEKKSTNLINAIENSKNIPLENFIYAISINNVGIKTARDLANYYKSFENFRNAKYEELLSIGDIGPITAQEIVDFFHESHIVLAIDKILSLGIRPYYEEIEKEESIFTDKKIVLTGTLSIPRKKLEEILIKKGAKISSSVSNKVDYVIIGENPGSKYDKAVKLEIKIINEDEIREMLGEEYGA